LEYRKLTFMKQLSLIRGNLLLFITLIYVNFMFFIADGELLGPSSFDLAFYTPEILDGQLIRFYTWIFIHASWFDILVSGTIIFYLMGVFIERAIGTHRFIVLLILNITIASLMFLIYDSVFFQDYYYFSLNLIDLIFIGQLIFIKIYRSNYFEGLSNQFLVFFIGFYFLTYFLKFDPNMTGNLIGLVPIGIGVGYFTSIFLLPKNPISIDEEIYQEDFFPDTNNNYYFCPFCGAQSGAEEYCIECHKKLPIQENVDLKQTKKSHPDVIKIIGYTLFSFLIWPLVFIGLAIWKSIELRQENPTIANSLLMIITLSTILNLWIIFSIF